MSRGLKLTKRAVEAVKPQSKESFIWDSELKGLGLRVAAQTGLKTFVLQYRRGSKQRRLTLGRYPALTVEKAREAALRGLTELLNGGDPAAQRADHKRALTVAEVCDEYLAAASAGLVLGRAGIPKKTSTLSTDAGRIERHIKPVLGALRACDVTGADIDRFKNSVAQGKTAADVKTGLRGRAIVKGGKGAATRTLGLLGGIFEWARAQGRVPDNPVRNVRRFADGRREILYTVDQLAALGAALRSLENGSPGKVRLNPVGAKIIRCIALTGLRRDEARMLRWDEVDLEGRCLRLKSSKSVRVRPLGKAASDLLANMERTGEYVFPSTPGGRPNDGLPKWWARLKAEAAAMDLPESSTIARMMNHGLRHTVAGTADRLGYTEATVKAMLGHKGSGVTAGYIHKPLDDVLLAAMDRVTHDIAAAVEKLSEPH